MWVLWPACPCRTASAALYREAGLPPTITAFPEFNSIFAVCLSDPLSTISAGGHSRGRSMDKARSTYHVGSRSRLLRPSVGKAVFYIKLFDHNLMNAGKNSHMRHVRNPFSYKRQHYMAVAPALGPRLCRHCNRHVIYDCGCA